jgi:DNA-binding GntR family transcriptional regulator
MDKENFEEFAYRSIIRMILENKFNPGDFLLETELADKLNLSRTPVRHALSRLVAEGFLEKKKKKGCIIPVPSIEDARQVFAAREIIESHNASTAAKYATRNDINELRSMNKKLQYIYKKFDKEEYSITNEKFHMKIAEISRNKYLKRYTHHIFWRSNVYIFFFDRYYIDREGVHFTPQQHSKIIGAIEKKDSEKAANEMKRHISSTYELLFLPWKAKKS